MLRRACSIPDPSSATVIVTGGAFTLDTVSRYSLHCTVLYVLYCTVIYCTVLWCTLSRYRREGWVEDLPPLNVGRYEHGCGSYVSGGDMVTIYYLLHKVHRL